jgi:hypothetical protein
MTRRQVSLGALVAALGAVVLLVAAVARASVEARSLYSKAQTYNAALRYLRVDLGYEVTEKDPDAAYLLFHVTPEGKKPPANGSFEIVEQNDSVRFFVRLPELPQYREMVLSDGLLKKLRTEYGEPPPRNEQKRRPKREDPPDGG